MVYQVHPSSGTPGMGPFFNLYCHTDLLLIGVLDQTLKLHEKSFTDFGLKNELEYGRFFSPLFLFFLYFQISLDIESLILKVKMNQKILVSQEFRQSHG